MRAALVFLGFLCVLCWPIQGIARPFDHIGNFNFHVDINGVDVDTPPKSGMDDQTTIVEMDDETTVIEFKEAENDDFSGQLRLK